MARGADILVNRGQQLTLLLIDRSTRSMVDAIRPEPMSATETERD
eukprot:COSAG02_NODE_46298_length_350_cov_0.617530_1_plen_44_part_10